MAVVVPGDKTVGVRRSRSAGDVERGCAVESGVISYRFCRGVDCVSGETTEGDDGAEFCTLGDDCTIGLRTGVFRGGSGEFG
jgi:hypothetical protein